MDQEVVFFQDKGGLLISDRRVMLGGVTHLPKDVSSAKVVRSRPHQGYVLAFIGVGAVLLFIGSTLGGLLAAVGFFLIAAGMAVRVLSREWYVVLVTVRGEEAALVRARDMLYADTVCTAITRASKATGGWQPPRPDDEEL